MSEVQLVLLILGCKYGVNFTASMIIVIKLTIFNYKKIWKVPHESF
jgi:hypothetical protein